LKSTVRGYPFTCILALGVVVVVERSGQAQGLPHAGPNSARSANARLEQDASCAKCHSEIAKEWEQSWHHKAFVDAEFQAGLTREPTNVHSICIGCHAPESAGSEKSLAQGKRVGITCVTCHLPPSPEQVTVPSAKAAPSGGYHAGMRLVSVRDVSGCAGCHEFKFITPRPSYAPEFAQWMQRTVREHYDGRDGEENCVSCHMRQGGTPTPHHDHRMLGGHEDGLVRRAIEVTVTRPHSNLVRVELSPKHVSHAVPTGDLFRRLAIYVQPRGYSPLQGPLVRYLGRHHVRIEHGQRLEVRDDRPFKATSTVDLDLEVQLLDEAVDYRVVYERVSYLRGDDERNAVVGSEVVLAEGSLPPPIPVMTADRNMLSSK